MAASQEVEINSENQTNNSANDEISAFQTNFEQQLRDFYAAHANSAHNVKKPWTSDRIVQVIEHIKKSRVATQKDSSDYYWSSKYDIMEVSGQEFLIFKKKSVDDPTVRIVPVDEYFKILTEVHKALGHGGREKIIQNIKNKIHIPKKAIEIYVKMCGVCEMKRSLPKKGIVTNPIISADFNSRGQVDLIDLQSAPDGRYKWLMNFQDHSTKFLHLRPLTSKKAAEVAFELLKIFLEFGAPCILQTDNGKEFTARVIEELVQLWPECKIIHGGPRRPQTQGSVERSNQDVENMLRCWMKDNNSAKWSVGCYFVQYYKNSSFHRIIGRSPYRALFGADPKTILKGTNVPDSVISSIQNQMENVEMETESVKLKAPEEDVKDVPNINDQDVPITDDLAIAPVMAAIEVSEKESDEMVSAIVEAEVASDHDVSLNADPTTPAIKILKIENAEMASIFIDSSKTARIIDIHNLAMETADETPGINSFCPVSIQNSPLPGVSLTAEPDNLNSQNSEDAAASSPDKQTCLVCGNDTTGAHSCISCSKPVHVICGIPDGKEGYGSQVLCLLCKKEQDISVERQKTHIGIKRAAEKMIDHTVKKLPLLEIGNSVFLNVPKFDRGPLDTKNIAGKIVDIRNGVFKIGTSSGTIKNWFPRQDLQISAKDYNGVISESLISLRHAVTRDSMFSGQGFQKCSCKPAKNQCHTKRCACFKNNILCTSKCHQSLSCINK